MRSNRFRGEGFIGSGGSAGRNAVAALKDIRDQLAAENPDFAAASRIEGRADAFCRQVRDLLRQARRDSGLSQAELAARLDLSQPAISKLEAGGGDIGLRAVFRLADALGLRPNLVLSPKDVAAEAPQPASQPDMAAMQKLRAEVDALFRQVLGDHDKD